MDSLPVETLEHIVDAFSDSDDALERWRQWHMHTFLTCALVCKTWTSIARRRLLSLYFPSGEVRLRWGSTDVLALTDIFRSPLCTIHPASVKILHFVQKTSEPPSDRVEAEVRILEAKSIYAALSTLDAAVFPFLQTLVFDIKSLPPLGSGSDDDAFEAPLLPVLSQVKSLVFRIFRYYLFSDIVHLIRLCPSVEEVTAFFDNSSFSRMDSSLYVLHPPASLRSLVLDMHALLDVTYWMMTCPPYYANISSLVIHRFFWDEYIDSNNLQRFLDGLGRNLQKLVLHVPEYSAGGRKYN